MPKGTRVHRCVMHLVSRGMGKVSAIRICQKQTKQVYKTGEPIKQKGR